MSALQERVRLEVQAALLNSECSPDQAIQAAISVLAEFAYLEGSLSEADLVTLIQEALVQARETYP